MRFVDYFINQLIREDVDKLHRARLLVGMIESIFLLLCAYLLALTVQPVSDFLFFETALYIVPLNLFFIGLLFYFKRFNHFDACVQIFVCTSAVCSIGVIYLYGGPQFSPALSMLLVPAIIGFCLGGQRTGIFWGIFSATSLYAMFFLYKLGFQFPSLNPDEDPTQLKVVNWTIAFLITIGVLLVYENINQRLKSALQAEREHLRSLALHDPLTGIANRIKFEQRLARACELCDLRGTGGVALLYIDLDGFKPVNDRFGHHIGDQVLSVIANRLISHTRDSDVVARIGGDEFVVLMEYSRDAGDLEKVAAKLVHSIEQNMAELPAAVALSASIGIALYPLHTRDPRLLIHYADQAMYQAKNTQTNFCIYQLPAGENVAEQGTAGGM